MRNGLFTPEEKEKLLANKYVIRIVNDSQILYSAEFKKLFMEKYNAGEQPSKIFTDAGFDTKLIGTKRIERCSYRWRAAYANGETEVFDAGPIRHEAKVRKQENRISNLKKEHKAKTDMLQNRLDNALKRVNYLQSELSRLQQVRDNNVKLKVQYYLREGIDVSEEITYIGLKIKELRQTHGISMVKLSAILGFSHDTLRHIERGLKPVPIDVLLKLMIIFDCSIDTFFKNDSLETDEEN